jgi:hypothetical protein
LGLGFVEAARVLEVAGEGSGAAFFVAAGAGFGATVGFREIFIVGLGCCPLVALGLPLIALGFSLLAAWALVGLAVAG